VSLYEEEFNGDSGDNCHLQWFVHGSSTLLEQMAGSREIFEHNTCDSNSLSCIAGKINVDYVGDSKDTFESGVVETRYISDTYFYRQLYSNEELSFTHVPNKHLTPDCDYCKKSEEVRLIS